MCIVPPKNGERLFSESTGERRRLIRGGGNREESYRVTKLQRRIVWLVLIPAVGGEIMSESVVFELKLQIQHLEEKLTFLAGGTNGAELAAVLMEKDAELEQSVSCHAIAILFVGQKVCVGAGNSSPLRDLLLPWLLLLLLLLSPVGAPERVRCVSSARAWSKKFVVFLDALCLFPCACLSVYLSVYLSVSLSLSLSSSMDRCHIALL